MRKALLVLPPDSQRNVNTVSIGAQVGSPHTTSFISRIRPKSMVQGQRKVIKQLQQQQQLGEHLNALDRAYIPDTCHHETH